MSYVIFSCWEIIFFHHRLPLNLLLISFGRFGNILLFSKVFLDGGAKLGLQRRLSSGQSKFGVFVGCLPGISSKVLVDLEEVGL